jgi:hypothetical protein
LIRLAPLTALYGKSGLGKSSLLQAGLFPLLRRQHYLPVYLHVDFSDNSSDLPLEQVARRLDEELARANAESPQRRDGESLWEYLHRENLEIWSKENFPLMPVLVFDQFEELFSPKISGTEKFQEICDSLADLIENRIPVEQASKPARSRKSLLNLLSHHYRIVISFREDFLPDLKSWEKDVPSLLRNYLRLEPMTRQCAIEAVEGPGQKVLERNVAPLIVDFVGRIDDKTKINNETLVEPVLLSLFCYQLNYRRKNGDRIDKNIVQSSGHDILQSFYQAAIDDGDVKGPPNAVSFIETFLVQGDRFRGNYPMAEAIDGNLLKQTQLKALIDRHRLLRIVQYPDTARIELIHDRLVEVVCKARDERKRREHQAEQRQQATQVALKLKRRFLRACAAIALVLFALGALLYRSYGNWVETRPWATLDSVVTGRRYTLSQDVANIGRPASDVVHLIRQVKLYAQPVSRIHLMIFRNFYAIDVRSLYGTTINGEFLPYGGQKQLADGDVIVLAGTAAFVFRPLAYRTWQFVWDPPLSHETVPSGWGLLIDSKRRMVFPLTREEEFIAPAGQSGVEPLERSEGAIAIVRRHDVVGQTAVSSDSAAVELFENPTDGRTVQLLAFAHPGTAGESIDGTGSWLTIEDVADGRDLQADIKIDDYSYGQFVLPQRKELFFLQGIRGHSINELAFHEGERRFQVIWLEPSIEGPANDSTH